MQKKRETSGLEPRSFDARVAAAVLSKLAALAERDGVRVLDSKHPAFSAALGVLDDARVWLGNYETPFHDFLGHRLLKTLESKTSLATRTFASALLRASLELEMLARLVELRDVRLPDGSHAWVGAIRPDVSPE
jgi:hypothetical protein